MCKKNVMMILSRGCECYYNMLEIVSDVNFDFLCDDADRDADPFNFLNRCL